ncbi:hypothetical protein GCM10009530_40310 [Microbispora corallina]|uniref:Uncharacterized protein n=1 Tax=Microbispora corallina TaxID=83302 RepID=A0ABQ4GB89_9ACTN|nr:hypothetical protein Mco01_73560 [Microbispora corallina]
MSEDATRRRYALDVRGLLPSLEIKNAPDRDRLGAFGLFKGGGQGQGRPADLPLFRRTNHPARVAESVVRGWWTVAELGLCVGTLLSGLLSPQPWLEGRRDRHRADDVAGDEELKGRPRRL